MANAAIGRNPIRPGDHRHRHLRHPGAMRAHIGALVEVECVLHGQDPTLRVERGGRVMVLLARVVGGHQVLAPILDPFDRSPQSQSGEADKKIFRIELTANPEPAAGIALPEHDGRRAAAEHARQPVAVAVRHFGRAIQFKHVSGGVEAGQHPARLHRYGAVPADGQVEGGDPMRCSKCCLDIAISRAQVALAWLLLHRLRAAKSKRRIAS